MISFVARVHLPAPLCAICSYESGERTQLPCCPLHGRKPRSPRNEFRFAGRIGDHFHAWAATIWYVFRVGQHKKERSSGLPKGSLVSSTLRLMIHSKFAEAAPHAVLSQVPQEDTRVLFCTRRTGATHADMSCSSSSNWARLRDLSACSCACTAFLGTFPHGFPFVFSALRRASRA